jgi:GNAT superfamily N-acetyltransferase
MSEISIRPLGETDLAAADRIFRLAFGTFLGLPEPETFAGDADYIRTRWLADPAAAFGAEAGGALVGSNMATHWGSIGFFGPLAVHPEMWDRGVGKRLMEPIIALFDTWGVRHAGLFTFAHSPKHVGLYQKFGFWPQHLTCLMSRAVAPRGAGPCATRFSDLPASEKAAALVDCRDLTHAVYEGLDLEREIVAVDTQGLGDTVLLGDGARLAGFAVCHCGAGSEAGSGACYVKFGAARPGPSAAEAFERLIDACEALAAARGLSHLVAGVNLARHEAYRRMLARGFRTQFQGVVLQRENQIGYNRPDVYLLDDWR